MTQPGQISRWFTDSAEIDLRPNGTGTLVWDGRATSQPATVHLCIVTIEPPRTFSFRWLHPAGAAAGSGRAAVGLAGGGSVEWRRGDATALTG